MKKMLVRKRRNAIVCFIWIACASFVAGCASSPTVFHMNPDSDPAKAETVWPEGPEVPRYRYAGQLFGERNFVKEKESVSPGKILRWIAGLVTGKKAPITLQRPLSGVVDDSGRIYVTDMSKGALFVFDEKEGKLLVWEMATPMVRFKAPVGVAIGWNGDILVSDSELGIVARLNRQGKPIGVIGKGQLTRPTGLAYDAKKGILYVADSHAHNIKLFTDDGKPAGIIGKRGEGKGDLNFPTHLAFADGKLYVSDTINARIQIFSESGDYLGGFGERGLYVGNLTRPKGVAVDLDGNIYVVESYYDYLLVFDKQGRFLLPIGGSGAGKGNFYLPAGVWTDKRERVYVADMFNRRVAVFQYLGEY